MTVVHRLPELKVVRRNEYLIEKCRGKRVLDLGAVDFHQGTFGGLHSSIMQVASSVVGLDYDREGIERAAAQGVTNIYFGDLQRLDQVELPGPFDIIMAGGIIEHLPNPGLFLTGVRRFFRPGTEMLLETPNAFSFHRFFLALRKVEYVHPEHVCYYSYSTLKHMLEIHDYRIKVELAHVLDGRARRLRKLLAGRNFNFANGFIFVVAPVVSEVDVLSGASLSSLRA